MPPLTRFAAQAILSAVIYTSSSFVAFAQPTPVGTKPSGSPTPGPGGLAPTMVVSGPSAPTPTTLPAMLQGAVTAEEYKTFITFQQHLADDPALKEINAKIATVNKELQQLRLEANAIREKLVASNPAVRAIQEKIMSAMHSHAGPVPVPTLPSGTSSGPTPGTSNLSGPKPVPSPAKTN